jgi:oxygen-independent coproporphyrinogen-3 oxidase
VHSYEEFLSAYNDARMAGFDNISVDLMYGIPEQTLESFCSSIDTVIELRPEHISSYGLKIEERTPFYKMRDILTLPDEDEELLMYKMLTQRLNDAGYKKYEISNFALDGRHSRHNTRYWTGGEYLGIGVAAYSYFNGQRFGNSRDLDGFLRGEDITEERYTVTKTDEINEYVMLSLRLSEGLSLEKYKKLTGEELILKYPCVNDFLMGGYMTLEGDRLCFTDEGFFISNTILSMLFE